MTAQLAETFVLVLKRWQSEVEARGRTFTVLVLPRESDTIVARALLRPFSGRVIFLREHFQEEMATFVADDHWNEYGNLQAASVLAQLEGVPFHGSFGSLARLADVRRRIERYYDEHR